MLRPCPSSSPSCWPRSGARTAPRSDLVAENLILRHQLVVGAPALSAHDPSSGDCTRSTTAPREAGQHFAVLQGGGSAGYRLA